MVLLPVSATSMPAAAAAAAAAAATVEHVKSTVRFYVARVPHQCCSAAAGSFEDLDLERVLMPVWLTRIARRECKPFGIGKSVSVPIVITVFSR